MKNISLMKVTAVVGLAAIASFIVSAEEDKPMLTQMKKLAVELPSFTAIDTDGNGMLSMPEVVASSYDKLKSAFPRLDSNNDSLLTKEEFSQFVKSLKQ